MASSKTKRIPRGPTAAELRDALDKIAAALSKAIHCFEVELQRPDSPAHFAGPIR